MGHFNKYVHQTRQPSHDIQMIKICCVLLGTIHCNDSREEKLLRRFIIHLAATVIYSCRNDLLLHDSWRFSYHPLVDKSYHLPSDYINLSLSVMITCYGSDEVLYASLATSVQSVINNMSDIRANHKIKGLNDVFMFNWWGRRLLVTYSGTLSLSLLR